MFNDQVAQESNALELRTTSWENQTRTATECTLNEASSLLTIIMSDERPSKRHRIDKVTRSVKGNLTSFSNLSRPPTPSPIDMDSIPDVHMALATTDALAAGISDLPPNIIPAVGVDHAPAIVVASTEASTVSPPSSVPFSASIPAVRRQLGSVSRSGPETLPTHMSPNTHGSLPLFQGDSIYVDRPHITIVSNLYLPFRTGQGLKS
ncbi:hypothetical protein BYT27DRAFT_6774864 [Phlegmacium glaucopus]|nr:hypothetical protein BYT27DRAFT_6774864 [Phlegmacium glaucopus]